MNDDNGERLTHIEGLSEYRGCTIVLLYVSRGKFGHDSYNAYTLLPTKPRKEYLGNQTWGGKTREAGIDTVHYHNEGMTMEQLKKDAINQIKEVIDDYYKQAKKQSKVGKKKEMGK